VQKPTTCCLIFPMPSTWLTSSSPGLRKRGGVLLIPMPDGVPAYWMWGPGNASDSTVLAVDALGQLRPYFASCRLLTSYQAPYHMQNDWTGLQIGVCTGPVAGWPELWPRLKHYG
jgi:hypothetical protein